MHRKARKIKIDKTCAGRSLLFGLIFIAMSVHLNIGKQANAQSDNISSIVTVPQGIKPLNPPEVFDPDNLFKKINGQAEFYLSAGFVQLKSQWFVGVEDADSMYEVYIYDMGDELNAFSVYSMQRIEGAPKVDLAQFAYQTENSLYMVHGPYYVELISVTPSKDMLSRLTSLAKNFIKDTPVKTKSIEALGLFPKENLDQDSISMIAKNAFGYERLDRVFTATYTIDESKVTVFISKRKTAREAKSLAIGFHKYFTTFGGKDIEPDVTIKDAKMVETMGTFDIMFALNSYFAGVHEASTKKQAEKLAEILAKKLSIY